MAIFNGTAGDDVLPPIGSDNSGNDQVFGLAGNDILAGGKGADLIDGGAGIDTADYSAFSWAVGVNLTGGLSSDGDTLASVENVRGSAFGERITGNAAANSLYGGGGSDTLIGNGGDDRLEGRGRPIEWRRRK